MDLSRNRGGIRRGDRADTGDLEARPTDGVGPDGSGVVAGSGGSTGIPTAAADALGGEDEFTSTGVAQMGDDALEDLTVLDAGDPELGLTDVGDIPADDWAADTGPTRTGEASAHGVDRRLVDNDRAPSGRKIDFDNRDKK